MDKLPLGPALSEHAETFGAYWSLLCEEPSWIRRRVMSSSIDDNAYTEYRVSLDIDTQEIINKGSSAGLSLEEFAPIPLTLLKKELQLEVDIRDSAGTICSVLTSDEDSFLGHAWFLKTLFDEGVFTPATLPDRVREQFFEIIRSHDGLSDLLSLLKAVRGHILGDSSEVVKRGMGEADVQARLLVVQSSAYRTLWSLAESYYFSSCVPIRKRSEVIKYRRIARHRMTPPALSLKPKPRIVQVNGIGTAARQHIKFDPPEGMGIYSAELVQLDGPGSARGDLVEVPIKPKIDKNKAIFYTQKLNKSLVRDRRFFIAIYLYSKYFRFFGPATLFSMLVFIFSTTGLYLELLTQAFSVRGSEASLSQKIVADPSASVTLFGLLPTLFAIYITRSENRFASRVHAIPRIVLVILILILLICAWMIAIDAPHDLLLAAFFVSFAASLVSSVYFLAVSAYRLWLYARGWFCRTFLKIFRQACGAYVND